MVASSKKSVQDTNAIASDTIAERTSIPDPEKTRHLSDKDIKQPMQNRDEGESSESDASVQTVIGEGGGDVWDKFQDEIPNGGLVAWLQVAGSFFIFFNSWGIINSFGVFQTYYTSHILSNFDTSAISWIGSVQSSLLLLLGSISGRFVDMGYMRSVLVVGSLMIVFGIMMTSVSTQYYQIFLAQGILTGAGGGLAFLPGATASSTWFTSKRAFTMGVAATGSSIGGVIYPIVLRQLIPRVGFPWAVRVCGFIAFTTLSFSVLVMRSRVPPRKAGPLFEFRALKETTYTLFVIGSFLGFMGVWTPFFFIGGYAKQHGVNEEMSFYILSLMNAGSTFGRVLPNILADRIGAINMFIPCAGISSILIILLKYTHNTAGLIAYAISYGFISGSFVSLPPVVIASLTKDFSRLGSRLGLAFATCRVSILVGPPISGAIIGKEGGRHDGALVFSGVVGITGVLIVAGSRVSKTGWKLRKKA